MYRLITAIISLSLTSCATPKSARKRFLIGGGIGGAGSALAAYNLSPNKESRDLNALVFGLTGAVVGGLAGMLLYGEDEVPKETENYPASLGADPGGTREFVIDQEKQLPEFLRTRFRPAIVEEVIERDQINEDGSISEPHKVYRIKRPAEIVLKPAQEARK